MARMRSRSESEIVLFNVTYEDGTMTSNRKVAASLLTGLDADAAALAVLEAQDREIAERSGRPRGPIRSVVRCDPR